MDHIKLLNQVRSPENIEQSFRYALNDRKYSDYYFDHCEIEYATIFKEQIIKEIVEELQSPESFQVRYAYAYYLPKNNLCYRRMIYLPFKDLVIRYAFVTILANLLDKSLSQKCFSYRRASDKRFQDFLLEDHYTVSWTKFSHWQKECAQEPKYKVLIRTDISSFYDSISHQYFLNTLAKQLSIAIDTEFLQLLSKLLCPSIISYSHKTKKIRDSQKLHQGLTIGNHCEGVLANLYLREIDEVMQDKSIEFGRYSDDIRIFATDRERAHLYLLILQEHLLTKGLNLNTSKTKIAENKEEIEELRIKLFNEASLELYDTSIETKDTEDSDFLDSQNEIEKHIDKEKDIISLDFNSEKEIENEEDAKIFCSFLQKYLEIKRRQPKHIEKLERILTRFQGRSKQATWLLVQSTYYYGISDETKTKAIEILFKVLKSNEALSYTKYRLIHHLINPKKDRHNHEYQVINRLKKKQEIKNILIQLLEQPAFELNITVMYALKILGTTVEELDIYIQKYISKPLGTPVLDAFSYLQELEIEQNST